MKRVNVFSLSFMDRIMVRAVVYKGGSNEVPETAQEVELKRVAIERWNDHQARLLPAENAYIKDVTQNPAAMKSRAAGMINADVSQKVGKALPSPPGLNPNSGRVMTATPGPLSTAAAKAQATAGQNVEDNRAKGLQSVINLGQGKASTAMKGFGSAALDATRTAITDAATDQQDRASTAGAVMSGVGVGAGVWKNMGTGGGFSPDYSHNSSGSWDSPALGGQWGDPGYSFPATSKPTFGPLR
jgi:hypothetical protein